MGTPWIVKMGDFGVNGNVEIPSDGSSFIDFYPSSAFISLSSTYYNAISKAIIEADDRF